MTAILSHLGAPTCSRLRMQKPREMSVISSDSRGLLIALGHNELDGSLAVHLARIV